MKKIMHFKNFKKHAIPSDTVMSDRRNPAVSGFASRFLKAYEDQAASTRSIAIISQAKGSLQTRLQQMIISINRIRNRSRYS